MNAALQVAEVPAGRGAGWLTRSFDLFRRKPFGWIGLVTGWIVITFGLIFIPIVGGVAANFLQPAFFASFAIVALRQERGEPVMMGDLFLGFRRNLRALINLGAVLLLAEITIFVIMALLGLPMGAPAEEGKTITMADYVQSLQGKEWILVVGFVLTVLVKGALWFAPPLIAFHDMGTGQAMRWSVYAAVANIGAMAVYGLALGVIFFLGLLPWALGLLVVMPMMAISTYVGYKDVFETRVPTPDPAVGT